MLITAVATAVALAVVAVQASAADPPAGPAAHPTPLPTTTTIERVPADLVRHTAQAGRVVALTFDDGPHTEYTRQVLDLLARYGAVATFCIVGVEAARHPELVRAVAAAGMALCSHTVNHDGNLPARTDAQIEAEVVGGQRAVLAAAGPGATVSYFRAPSGHWSQRVQDIAAGNGMRPLSWSVDSRDWQRPGTGQIVATVQRAVHPGAVILMHDGGGRRDQTVAALAELLPWFVEQGYGFAVP